MTEFTKKSIKFKEENDVYKITIRGTLERNP